MPERPPTKILTVTLEGTVEPMPARLFSSADAGLTARFSTYVPADLAAAGGTDSLGEFARFSAAFGDQRNDDAYLKVVFLPPGIDSAAAIARYRAAARALATGPLESIPPRQRWTSDEVAFVRAGDGATAPGWAALARHGDRWFFAVRLQPEEYHEGMGPRVAAIWTEWRWEDTGEGL